jgi:hypothetical protein
MRGKCRMSLLDGVCLLNRFPTRSSEDQTLLHTTKLEDYLSRLPVSFQH